MAVVTTSIEVTVTSSVVNEVIIAIVVVKSSLWDSNRISNNSLLRAKYIREKMLNKGGKGGFT